MGETAAIDKDGRVRVVGWLARDGTAYGLGCAPRGRPLIPIRGCGPAERCAECGRTLYEHLDAAGAH